MLILLPPSETKRDGGAEGSSLDLAALSFPSLGAARRTAIAGLRRISGSVAASTKALGLGPKQRFEIDRNRAIRTSPTMPAIERYTGVLYDAVDVESLTPSAREFLGDHVVVHSALFGLIRANDPIPAYRFSHDTKVPGSSLPKIWRDANARVLAGTSGTNGANRADGTSGAGKAGWASGTDGAGKADGASGTDGADRANGTSAASGHGLVLDLRSESYVHLGPTDEHALFLRVVSDDGSGHRRALNHFNKHGKGELVRALALAGEDFDSVYTLLDWAHSAGIALNPGVEGELELLV